MITKACDQCGKAFTAVHRTTCFICQPMKGPSREQMLAMAGLEDDGGCSCSVGGMATDLGIYPAIDDIDALTADNARLQSRVAELDNTSTIDNAYIDKLEMLLRLARPYITVNCPLATQIDGVLNGK